MKQPTEKTIDKDKYTFTRMTPSDSLKVLTRLAKLIAAPMGAVVGKAKAGDTQSILDKEIDFEKALYALADRVNEDDVLDLVKTMMKQVLHHGSGNIADAFDAHFMDDDRGLGHMFKVFSAALEVEYGAFFGVSLGGVKDLFKAAITPDQ